MMRLPDKRPDRYYPRVVRKRPTKYPTKKNASQLNWLALRLWRVFYLITYKPVWWMI